MEKCLKLRPAVAGSGFKMEGYYVWCGSVIKEGGTYYLFAARWPKEKGFPLGYLTDSEIVLATTDDLSKPFEFKKVIISKRDGDKWDSCMAHNPYIFKDGDTYVLFYIGSPDGGIETRAIGYAYSKSLTDGWIRSDEKIDLIPDANNPAVTKTTDGKYLMYFRDGDLNVYVARADKFSGPYEIINDHIFKKGIIEDMFVYIDENGKYIMVAEDAAGKYTGLVKAGVRFESCDGVDWDGDSAVLAYDYDVDYDDGTHLFMQRRERPFILDDNGRRYLFTTAKINGEERLTGGDTWNMVQEIEEEYK